MATEGSRGLFRLNPVDRLGRTIDASVLAAAEEIYPRAFEHGLRLLGDPAVVTNALEEVAASVSRVVQIKDPPGEPAPIRNLPGYVFRAFVRRVNRLKRKQLVLVSSGEDGQPSVPRWADPSRKFEIKILVDECLARCDFVTQDMFWRRMQGFSWEEIGRIHELSAHAAEARFSNALRRARVRLKIK
jgi:DNA-directed RNA polymerase specialized sigma24 family protein